jgi:outer membrane autotransporter protein
LKGAGAGQGVVNVTNTEGVTFSNAQGTGASLLTLDVGTGASATLGANTNLIAEVKVGSGSTLNFGTGAFTDTGTLVTTVAANAALADINAAAKIKLPANFVGGTTMNLFHTTDADMVATAGLAQLNTNVQDTPLVNYVVTKDGAANIAVVTATDKSASETASELGVNTNKALGLLNARGSIITGSDTAALAAINTVLNAQTTTDTAFTNQIAPQTDTIAGSTVAAKAVTSGVQNIMSTRLASLRSGDAFSTGVVTGSGMSANSGFIQAFGSTVEQKNKGNEFGYDADTTGFALGFDGKISDGVVLGISYANSKTDVDGKGTGKAKNDIKTNSGSIYADYTTKDGYVEGSITYGKSDNKGSRVINTGGLSNTYTSNYDSEQYSFRLSGGIPQSLGGGAFFTPFAAATISKIKTDAYTETSTTTNDALRLRVAQDTVDSQVGTIGVKYHQVIKDGKTTFTPEVKLALNNEFGDGNITTTNTYQGGGASFKNSTAIERTSATAGVGLNISSDNVSFNIGYEADVREKYLGHSAQAKISAKF